MVGGLPIVRFHSLQMPYYPYRRLLLEVHSPRGELFRAANQALELVEVLYLLSGCLCPAHAVFVDVRRPRLHSQLGCVPDDVPKPHSCALVGDVSDYEVVVPAPGREFAADELAVVAEGHFVAAVCFGLHAFASRIAAAVADGSHVLGPEHWLVALPAVAAARLAADANAHTHLAAPPQSGERVLGVAVQGPLCVFHVSPHSEFAPLP